jgi:hypothetical protein
MGRNQLRGLLEAGQPSLRTHFHISGLSIGALIGHSGMVGYGEFIGGDARYDLYALGKLGRAVDHFPRLSDMLKIGQEPHACLNQGALGSGRPAFVQPREDAVLLQIDRNAQPFPGCGV